MRDEQKKEFTGRIVNANRSELVVIKYEMMFAYMDDAAKALDAHSQENSSSTASQDPESDENSTDAPDENVNDASAHDS